jgi:type I restriction enzyme R subunit
MIGRGTRVLDPDDIKPWCPKKENFLIMDCWENFSYFNMTPKGKEPKPTTPLPVRLFEARINKLRISKKKNIEEIVQKTIIAVRKNLSELPKHSVVILDNQEYLEKVMDDNFWINLTDEKLDYLDRYIKPLMRVLSNADFKAMHFILDIIETQIARLLNDRDRFEVLRQAIIEKVSELPLSVNIVAKEREWIEKVQSTTFWSNMSDDDLGEIAEHLAPLMKYRQPYVTLEKKLNIQDLLTVKETVEFGPQHERMTVDKYRKKVEEFIHDLQKSNPILQKIAQGKEISDEEVNELAEILKEHYPHVTEYILREIYDNRSAKFVQFIKHILGIEEIATFAETVSIAFDDFLRKHNNYGEKQIQFLLTLKTFILQRGVVKKRDLIDAPFTQLHPEGIRGVFKTHEIEEILRLTQKIAS